MTIRTHISYRDVSLRLLMHYRKPYLRCLARFILPISVIVCIVIPLSSQNRKNHLSENSKPKVISLDPGGKDYVRILSGPPESAGMKSGLVVLGPGKDVRKHSTENHEELLIVLEGTGEMEFHDGSKLPVIANTAVYCPSHTEHNVVNTGSSRLRYVYVVARVQATVANGLRVR